MAARFIGNREVNAGASPLRAVWRDPAAAGAKLREQMRQLVAKSAVNFGRAVRSKAAIEEDARGMVFRATGGAAEPGRPLYSHLRGHYRRAVLPEQVTRNRFQRRIAAGRYHWSWKNKPEVELDMRKHVPPEG